eukprot:5718085-Pleurochrysis_carterae.AAC.1
MSREVAVWGTRVGKGRGRGVEGGGGGRKSRARGKQRRDGTHDASSGGGDAGAKGERESETRQGRAVRTEVEVCRTASESMEDRERIVKAAASGTKSKDAKEDNWRRSRESAQANAAK